MIAPPGLGPAASEAPLSSTDRGVLLCGLALVALPIALAYMVMSRRFIAGLTQGALK